MAVDTSFELVSLLLQGGSTVNAGPLKGDGYRTYNLVVTPTATTTASDHLAFSDTSSLFVADPTIAAGVQYGGGNVALDTSSMEVVVEHAWAPNANLFRTATLQARGHHDVPNRYEVFARAPYWYSPYSSKLTEFDLPASGKVLVRVMTGAVDSVQVVPETGAAVTIDHGVYSTFSYPILLGDTGESMDVAPSATVASASNVVDVYGSSGVIVPAILVLPPISFTGRPAGQTPAAGSVTLAVAGVSTTVANVAGMSGSAITSLLAAQAAALLNAGAAWYATAQAGGSGTTQLVLTPRTSSVIGGTSASISGSAEFSAAPGYADAVVPLTANASLQQYPSYSPPPAVAQTQSAYITVNDPTKPLKLNWVVGTTTLSFDLQNNVAGAISAAAAATASTATQIGPTQWRIITTRAEAGFGFTVTEAVPSRSAVTKLYGLRVTYFADRRSTEFPTLPWPTTSIPPDTGGGGGGDGGGGTVTVPANVRYYYPFESGDTSPIANQGSVATELELGVGVAVASDGAGGFVLGDGVTTPSGYYATPGSLSAITGACTMECWVKVDAATTTPSDLFGGAGVSFILRSSGYYALSEPGVGYADIAIPSNNWQHLAVVRDGVGGSEMRAYLDGVLVVTDNSGVADWLYSGVRVGGGVGLTGTNADAQYDDLIVTAAAKYTANFTPPTRGDAFPNTGGGVTDPTLLLLHLNEGSGATTDDASLYNRTVNVTNYSAGATAGKFSGGLNLASAQATIQNPADFSLGTTWTIEFFLKANSATSLTLTGQPILLYADPSTWGNGWAVYMRAGILQVWLDDAYQLPLSGETTDTSWHHYAICSNGVGLSVYRDGLVINGTAALNLNAETNATGLYIGWDGPGGTYPTADFTVDEIRIRRDCIYTGAFTPPTSPFADPTADSGGGSDVQGAGYNDVADFTSTGQGNQQANFPDAYGSGSSTLEDITADQSIVIDNNSVNGTSARTLANFTNTGNWVAALPTNADGATTLDDFTADGSGLASVPIEVTAAGTLDDSTQLAVGLFLAPSEGTADILLEEFTSTGAGELRVSPTGRIAATMPTPTAYASGQPKRDGLNVTMTMPTVVSYGRGAAFVSMPAVTASATGTVANVGTITVTMPFAEVQATGRVSGTAAVQVFMPSAYEMVGYGGGVLSATVEGYAAQATGISGTVGGITATLPMVVVEAIGTQVNTGQITAEMPMLVPSPSGRLTAVMPMVRVVASGSAVVTVTHEAYVLNMSKPMDDNPRNNFEAKNDQMTRYTNFPFTQVVRYLNSYYGVAADGLYLLEGTADNGAPINWNVDLCMTDFGSSEKKNVASVYLGGQAGPTVDFTIQSGETADQLHAHTTTAVAVKRNHRQKFGLGRRTRYYSLGLSGQGDLAIDSIEFEVANTTRRI